MTAARKPIPNAVAEHSAWVEDALARLTLEQKIGQLMGGICRAEITRDEMLKLCGDWQPGTWAMAYGTVDAVSTLARNLQDVYAAVVPMAIMVDFENGPGRILKDGTQFPDALGIAAAGDPQIAYQMGKAAAIEGRAAGVHWTLAPVVDVNKNPFNPIANTRSWGDDPDRMIPLVNAFIRGLQDHGMAACSKHYPGDGMDDRDQHVATSINPLTMEQWHRLSGKTFAATFEAGVWSIMTGHISLPAWDPGKGGHISAAPPATLSRKISTELLREVQGYQGVITTDAMGMGGVVMWHSERREMMLQAIEAGADVLLFSDIVNDGPNILAAVRSGRIPVGRIDASVRRILRIKELMKLTRDGRPTGPVPPKQLAEHVAVATQAAERQLTLVSAEPKALPIDLNGKRVLSVHLRADANYGVDLVDDHLRAAGATVRRITEADLDKDPYTPWKAEDQDLILFNVVYGPNWGTDRIRLGGNYMRRLWMMLLEWHPRMILVSYGSPYVHYEVPFLRTVINAYSIDPGTQAAVVKLLQGRIQAVGRSPVDLETPWKLSRAYCATL